MDEQITPTRRFYVILLSLVLFALVDGFVFGVFAALSAQPASAATDTQAETDDYIALISATFQFDQDLAAAMQRLSALNRDANVASKLVVAARTRATAHHLTQRAESIAALAQALRAATALNEVSPETPTPTFTPFVLAALDLAAPAPSTPTPQNTLTSAPATTTRTNTPTRAPAATRTATPTRLPTSTRTPRPKATATQVVVPQSTATATPSVDYKITLVRQLTPCENEGNHNIYVLVLDQQGNGIAGVQVEAVWSPGSMRAFTGQKVEYIPSLGVNAQTTAGFVNLPMYKGSYRVHVLGAVSEWTDWLTVDIPRDELCAATDNPQANSLFHYSYLVVFQKVR